MLCSNNSLNNLRKLNIELHEKTIEPKNLDSVLFDMESFERRVNGVCVPVGFNAIRDHFDRSYMIIVGFSSIQDYICKREGLERVFGILQDMGYEEINNPFIIEIECSDGRKEILNSCLEERIFRKKLNGSEVYISIFPENAIYYKIRGKKIIENKIIFPKNPKIFTILSKLYRYNKRDSLDVLVITLISPEILKEIDEKTILEYVLEYSIASNIERRILLNTIYRNLLKIKETILKIKKYADYISKQCFYSLGNFGIDISDRRIELYLLSKLNKLNVYTGLIEIERLIEIIKNLKENRN